MSVAYSLFFETGMEVEEFRKKPLAMKALYFAFLEQREEDIKVAKRKAGG